MYTVQQKIAIFIQNALNRLRPYPKPFKNIVNYWVCNVIDLKDLSVVNLICNKFTFTASDNEKEEMYQALRKNLLYYWLVFNDIYNENKMYK